ncbi:MAG: hypothetical protein QF827_02680 [Alphaproteobacteria bacterium]|jgi:hypothetical protein|nr:hypothetical protein [Alphaproteobacteria bacterium]
MTRGHRLVAVFALAVAAGAVRLTAAAEHPLILEGAAIPAGGGAIVVDGQFVRLFAVRVSDLAGAEAYLGELMAGRTVRCRLVEADPLGHPIGRCAIDSQDLSGALIAAGWAVSDLEGDGGGIVDGPLPGPSWWPYAVAAAAGLAVLAGALRLNGSLRRRRDRLDRESRKQVLAGRLQAELASLQDRLIAICATLQDRLAENGALAPASLEAGEIPKAAAFDAALDDLGLLEPDLMRDLVLFHGVLEELTTEVRALRTATGADLSAGQIAGLIESLEHGIGRASVLRDRLEAVRNSNSCQAATRD